MSVWTFFSGLFNKVVAWFEKDLSAAKVALQKYLPDAISLGDTIYKALTSSTAVTIADIIPVHWVEAAREEAVAILAKLLQEFTGVNDCLQGATNEQIIECIISKWQGKPADVIGAWVHTIVALFALRTSNGELNWSSIASALEAHYQVGKSETAAIVAPVGNPAPLPEVTEESTVPEAATETT